MAGVHTDDIRMRIWIPLRIGPYDTLRQTPTFHPPQGMKHYAAPSVGRGLSPFVAELEGSRGDG